MVNRTAAALIVGLAAFIAWPAQAQTAPPPAVPQAELPLFLVEIKVGPKWDPAKPAQEQAYFQEHSANLRRLRESGSLLVGARYSDKGLVIVAASTIEDARKMMDSDPSIGAGTFVFEVHPFNVFYSGTIPSRPRR